MADNKNSYLIKSDEQGEVRISTDVISAIAAIAALEVEQVTTVGNDITREQIAKHSPKNVSKSVRAEVLENVVSIDVALNLAFDSSVLKIVPMVQEKVKNSIENMTGLEVADVNVKVIGVSAQNA